MKIILSICAAFLFLSLNAQAVSDYKYIAIPESFTGFDKNQYQLNNYLRLLLTQKEYEVLPENKTYWPEEVRLNPCLVLEADVYKNSSFLKNKLELSFKDCNDTEIVKLEGESNLKEYEAGFKDALRNAFATVPQQQAKMPTYRQEEINQVTIVTKKEIPNPGTELFRKSENPPKTETLVIDSNSQIEEFVHDGTSVYKLTIDANSFVLMDSTKSNILANYYPAAHSGVYHVKVNNGNNPYYTIGYNFNGKLSYEQKSGSNQWTLVEFEKK